MRETPALRAAGPGSSSFDIQTVQQPKLSRP
jgi:hypothetical protein